MSKKFEKISKLLNDINLKEEGLFDFTLEYDLDTNVYTIIDSTEEFYYDGYAFERIHDMIDSEVKKTFGEDYYIECECPGRWVICN